MADPGKMMADPQMADEKSSLDHGSAVPEATWTAVCLRDFSRSCGGRLSGEKSELFDRY